MSAKDFNQNDSYEWIGTFWFPDSNGDKPEQFSGKATYSPDKGIQLLFSGSITNFSLQPESISKKIMHGAVHQDGKPILLTLFNIFLSIGYTIGSPTLKTLKGSALLLAAGDLIEETVIDRLEFEYDEFFNNIFLRPAFKESDALKYAQGSPLTCDSNFVIRFEARSTGNIITTEDDIESVFWSDSQDTIVQLKKAIKPIIENNNRFISKRRSIDPSIIIQKEASELSDLLEQERLWRSFWELMIDHHINVKSCWLHVKDTTNTEKVRYIKRPLLTSYHLPKPPMRTAYIMPHLPINIYSFGDKGCDITNAQSSFSRWAQINKDKKWRPVIDGVERAADARENMVDTTKYVSLMSEIETLLDLIGYADTNTDTLINNFSSQNWLNEFSALCASKPSNQSFGKWSHEVRNTITHPKSAQKKFGGIYLPIVQDGFALQKVYAYISGLFIKAILYHIGGIKNEAIEKYIDQFIKIRVSFFPVNYT